MDGEIGRQTDRQKIWFIPCLPFSWDWELFLPLNLSRKATIFVVAFFNVFAVGTVIKKGDSWMWETEVYMKFRDINQLLPSQDGNENYFCLCPLPWWENVTVQQGIEVHEEDAASQKQQERLN